MILVTHVHVEGFRSLQGCTVAPLGNLNALVGKNSTGKSNILRALNLFFNGVVQEGRPVSFTRDLLERPKRRQKKRIAITVSFSLPASFKFRKQQDYLTVLGRDFDVKRIWELDPQRTIISRFEILAAGKPIANANDIAPSFLSLIRFRYIPNRTVPADILRTESQALAGSIFLRMKDQTHADALLEGFTAAAGRMLQTASEALKLTGAPLHNPAVARASLSEMVSMSGFQAQGAHGGSIQDEDWGAGHQAFFLYQVLHALDTDYSRFFGWRQAAIWAVEEPESALHRELETRLAAKLRQWTHDPAFRLQVLLTTHSPVFSMAADDGFWISLEDAITTARPISISQLSRDAESEGVSGWTHPILSHPWNPVVLVEGRLDAEALTHVSRLAGADPLRFLPLPVLDTEERSGGKDALIGYLRKHQQLLKHRQPEAPVVAVFDWEVSDQDLNKARAAYGPSGTDLVLRMNHAHADPIMGKEFKGIERFYPPRILLEAHTAGELVLGIAPEKPYSISREQLDASKGDLLKRLKTVTSPQELTALGRVIREIEGAARALIQRQRSLFDEPPV